MEQNIDKNCIFCKIVEGEVPSRTVYEDSRFKAILDLSPANVGHVIILPKNHAANIFELSEEDTAGIFILAKKIATVVQKVFNCDGINILQNNGEIAGQTVFHLHVHIVPRFQNDNVTIKWEQQKSINLDTVLEQLKKEI